jgi:MoxR-like ATPase
MGELTETALLNLRNTVSRIQKRIGQTVIGSERIIRFMFICLITDNHMLLEGVPGLAKTLLANEFARHMGLDFKRIQFTPDMLPSDVTGNMMFNLETRRMELRKGPIYTNILLADELNRTPPKVHSALLQGMEEKSVSIGGLTEMLPEPFFVIATQNPIEQEGTFPLAEALTDRFLFRYNLSYPTREEEISILKRDSIAEQPYDPLGKERIMALRSQLNSVAISDDIMNYIVDIIRSTREDKRIYLGASPRTTFKYFLAARANALVNGRDYVIPEDVKFLSKELLNHRIILNSEAMVEGNGDTVSIVNSVIDELVNRIEAPK